MTNKKILFTSQAANGNSAEFNAIGAEQGNTPLYTFITIYGVFDGASLQLQYKAADDSWYSTGDDAIIAPAAYYAQINSNVPYRFALSGVDSSTDISIDAYNAS